jgi:plastocyanin
MRQTAFTLLLLAALLCAAGCTSAPATNGTVPNATAAGTTANGDVSVRVVADQMAFDTAEITVPRDANVTVHFENRDDGIPHNVAVYRTADASDPIYVGEVVQGPTTIDYVFRSPAEPGTYHFQCDPHASFMRGSFVAT